MREGSDTRAHNTLSTEQTHVQGYYLFHPLRGAILQTFVVPSAVTVRSVSLI
ncbi:MAG TPA: hypothetical protein VEX68_21050 [Bryobacteraceae bacterium]|nr:hypothetical protein [Bryobacteraceae bacterium]